jgi:hypothetical protein
MIVSVQWSTRRSADLTIKHMAMRVLPRATELLNIQKVLATDFANKKWNLMLHGITNETDLRSMNATHVHVQKAANTKIRPHAITLYRRDSSLARTVTPSLPPVVGRG